MGCTALKGRRAEFKSGLAGRTTERVGGLRNRVGRRDAVKSGPAGCTKGWASGLQKTANYRTGRASGLYIYTCRRAVEKGGLFDTRADCDKNSYFSQFQTYIALYKMADRSMQGRTALNIIEIASFRRSSRCATWRAVR